MGGALKVRMLALVATQALLIDVLRGGFGKAEDLGYIATAIDVSLARTMTSFASGSRTVMGECEFCVRIPGKFLDDILVTGRASLGTDKVRWIRCCRCFGGYGALLFRFSGGIERRATQHQKQRQNK
jgi:hypothetical protein